MSKASGHLQNRPIEQSMDILDHLYMLKNFDVKTKTSTKLDLNTSTISRVCNQFLKATLEYKIFPKLVVIALDNNVISNVKYSGYGISDVYGQMIHWLVSEINKIVEIHKGRLPLKAVKDTYPSFLWFAPALNMNFSDNVLRGKFTRSLKANLEIQPNHMMMKLNKIWEYQDPILVRYDTVTPTSFNKFWRSIDSAIEFYFSHLAPGTKGQMGTAAPVVKSCVIVPGHCRQIEDIRRNDHQGNHFRYAEHYHSNARNMTSCEERNHRFTYDKVPDFFKNRRCFNKFHWNNPDRRWIMPSPPHEL